MYDFAIDSQAKIYKNNQEIWWKIYLNCDQI